jgi:hypothetical protein
LKQQQPLPKLLHGTQLHGQPTTAWTAHLEYQELLSGPLLVKLCIEETCCFYLEPRIRLKPFTMQLLPVRTSTSGHHVTICDNLSF